MEKINERLLKILNEDPIKDSLKLKAQQDYYRRLEIKGIIKKQSYNLKSISSV